MEARLIKILLRCIQSESARFPASIALGDFVSDYGPSVGTRKRASIYMTPAQKQVICRLLLSEGVAADTAPDAWDGLSRAQALALGHNEKLARDPVKRRRVAIKALHPLQPLFLAGQQLLLPARCHVEVDYAEIGEMAHHDWIVAVENWECFNDIHIAARNLDFPGSHPLIVWRGDLDGTRADSMLDMVRGMKQPVAAFVDYDPSGMLIALSLPRLEALVAPPLDTLAELMKEGLIGRYAAQIAGCQATLEKMNAPCVDPVWKLIHASGKALPQERFVR